MSVNTRRPPGLGYTHVAGRWGWFVALGIGLLLAGLFALGNVVAVTLVGVIFIGASLVVGGVFQLVHAFMVKGWQTAVLSALAGALYIVGGVLIMQEPVQGSMLVTLLLVFSLMVGGVFRVVIALRHREVRHWWMLLIGGLVTLVIGVLLMATLPWSGLWVLGTLIAVEMIVQGVTWLSLGIGLRHLSRA